jgi:hypothetical protein
MSLCLIGGEKLCFAGRGCLAPGDSQPALAEIVLSGRLLIPGGHRLLGDLPNPGADVTTLGYVSEGPGEAGRLGLAKRATPDRSPGSADRWPSLCRQPVTLSAITQARPGLMG